MPAAADIAGKQDLACDVILLPFHQDAGRTENMAGIIEGGPHPRANLYLLLIGCGAAEPANAVHRVNHAIERRRRRGLARAAMRTPRPCRFFLQVGGVQHHQPRQFGRRLGGDDLAAKTPLHQERQPPAMIEMGMGQEHKIDRARVKSERDGILLLKLTTALEQAAIDQDAPPRHFQEMTGAGDVLCRAVKGKFHVPALSAPQSGSPFFSYQLRMLAHASSAVSANQNSSRSSASITPS